MTVHTTSPYIIFTPPYHLRHHPPSSQPSPHAATTSTTTEYPTTKHHLHSRYLISFCLMGCYSFRGCLFTAEPTIKNGVRVGLLSPQPHPQGVGLWLFCYLFWVEMVLLLSRFTRHIGVFVAAFYTNKSAFGFDEQPTRGAFGLTREPTRVRLVDVVADLGAFGLHRFRFKQQLGHLDIGLPLKVLFTETECLVVSSDFKMPDENQILQKVPRHHNIYSFDMKTPTPAKSFPCLIAKATSDESKMWHRRLGHINFKNLNKLVKGNLVRGLPSKVFRNDHTCVTCHKGKQHRASCKAKLKRLITEPLHTLHIDLFGPTSVKSINHASYCLVITDDYTRFSWVFFLASKDETSGILQNLIMQIENQLNHRVKIVRSDNGTEFKNRDMLEFCGNKGIKQEYSNARTPQQIRVAERMNMTLIESTRTMLADSLLPTTFWAEAVSTACYVLNRVRVTKPQNKTPYELLFGQKPIISYIRPFGRHVTILDTLSVLDKFDGKSNEGFLVGYSLNSKAYRVYNLLTKRIEVNLHVNFLEDKPNVKGVGYRWMFDIEYLTNSMNYIPVSLENQANPYAAVKNTEEKVETRKSSTNSKKEKILTEPQQEKEASSTEDNPKTLVFREELEEIAQKHLGIVPENNSTNTLSVNYGSEPVNTGRLDPDDSPMPELENFHKSETGIFDEASYDKEGVVTDFNSLPTEVEVSPTTTLRIHSIHPKSQLLGDPKSVVQTRSKVQQKSGAHALIS
ncbi:putative ribonuclease H-like domain-containing protein, partial [Tanacetum coccineum]